MHMSLHNCTRRFAENDEKRKGDNFAMTREEICKSAKEMLTPGDICEILECNAQSIRDQARADASKLGFPVVIVGTRVKIPRDAFLKYLQG